MRKEVMRIFDINVINEALADINEALEPSEYDFAEQLSHRPVAYELTEDEQEKLDVIGSKLSPEEEVDLNMGEGT